MNVAIPMPRPQRIRAKGWFSSRDLSVAEAEAWHLRQAARLACSPLMNDRRRQQEHLEQADLNRVCKWRMPMPKPANQP